MKRTVLAFIAALVLLGAASQTQAAVITIYDNGVDNTQPSPANAAAIWTLTIAEGCQVCAATFQVTFTNLASNPYFAQAFYLESVQFSLNGTSITSISDTSAPTGTTIADWSWAPGSTNNNSCNVGDESQSGCGDWVGGASPPDGFSIGSSPVVYQWGLNVTFDETIDEFTTGNIRATFNDANGGNLRIFSPADGSFDGGSTDGGSTDGGGDGQDGGGAPEPGVLLLLGAGLVIAGARLRKR